MSQPARYENNAIAFISQPLHFDPMAGLHRVGEIFWRDGVAMLVFLVMITASTLNLYAMVVQFRNVMKLDPNEPVVLSGGMVHLHPTGMFLCPPGTSNFDDAFGATYKEEHCWKSHLHRRGAYVYISLAESCFYILFIYLPVLILSLLFLCGRRQIARNRPVFFFWWPQVMPAFSVLMFLSWTNLSRIHSNFFRGEMRIYWTLIRMSTLCRYGDDDLNTLQDRYLKKDPPMAITLLLRLLTAVPYAMLVVCAFQQLLVKMTAVAFVVMVDFRSFSLSQWLQLLAFINQIVGMFDIRWVERHRLLLFMFGGNDTEWQWREAFYVSSYFRLIADRIVQDMEKTCGKKWGRLPCLAAMWTADSTCFQRLLIKEKEDDRTIPVGIGHEGSASSRRLGIVREEATQILASSAVRDVRSAQGIAVSESFDSGTIASSSAVDSAQSDTE